MIASPSDGVLRKSKYLSGSDHRLPGHHFILAVSFQVLLRIPEREREQFRIAKRLSVVIIHRVFVRARDIGFIMAVGMVSSERTYKNSIYITRAAFALIVCLGDITPPTDFAKLLLKCQSKVFLLRERSGRNMMLVIGLRSLFSFKVERT
jgi:hypothetical protein